jgi:hypothetical protein
MLFAMVSLCLYYGEAEFAAYLSLSFHCLLRTEEGLQVRAGDLTPARNKMRLRLKRKSGNRFGTTEDAVIEAEFVLAVI